MPTLTYTPLANITLSSSAASVTFSSISQVYRDLVLVIAGVAATNSVQNSVKATFNSDTTASNYYAVTMRGNGSATASSSYNVGAFLEAFSTGIATTGITNITASFMDYSATDKHKSYLSRFNDAGVATGAIAGRWANTSAITSIALSFDSGTWASGSTFALYGIVA